MYMYIGFTRIPKGIVQGVWAPEVSGWAWLHRGIYVLLRGEAHPGVVAPRLV